MTELGKTALALQLVDHVAFGVQLLEIGLR
jgi:hypothetical protein